MVIADAHDVLPGEIAAAYTAGYVTAAEAIVIAYFRGHVVAKNKRKGCMLAIGLGKDKVQEYLHGMESDVKIAAINSPESVTLSGETDAIKTIIGRCKTEKVFVRVLKTGGNAYHSHHMVDLGEEYEILIRQGISEIRKQNAISSAISISASWVSSVNPEENIPRKPVNPAYWRRNLESPVLFLQAIESLTRSAGSTLDLLVEVGPHPALGTLLHQIRIGAERNASKVPQCLVAIRRDQDSLANMLTLAGELFIRNTAINLAAVNATDQFDQGQWLLAHGRVCIDPPNYVYNYGTPIYHETRYSREWRLRKHLRHDILGARQAGNSKSHPSWRNILRVKDVPWLADHKVGDHEHSTLTES